MCSNSPDHFPRFRNSKEVCLWKNKECIHAGVLTPASLEICLKQLNIPMIADRPDSLPHFSIVSDASNHGTTKLFLLALRYHTPDFGVQNKLLDFYDDCKEDSDVIFNKAISRLEESNLGLEQISAYSADNASINFGVHNSVYKKNWRTIMCQLSRPITWPIFCTTVGGMQMICWELTLRM